MNLLFYYPSNKRSNALETLIEELSNRKINIVVLTLCEKGEFHMYLESVGIKTYTNYLSNGNRILFYLKQILYLRSFCKRHKIDVVHSHLQQANFVSVLAQYFIKAKLVNFRHHFQFNIYSNDSTLEKNKMESFFDRIINKLSKSIVVPSSGVYNGMIRNENVKSSKLRIVPYIYNFDKYAKPDTKRVDELNSEFNCDLLILMCSRLIKFKRHKMVFNIIKKLVNEGENMKMLVLDDGPEKNELENFIKANGLEMNIFMLGFKTNFVDYMAATDILVHPSLTEASNSAVKEMGVLNKPVIVCEGVGDFSDYITNGENSFLIPTVDSEVHLENVLRNICKEKIDLNKIGKNLHETVYSRFNRSEEVINMYLELTK